MASTARRGELFRGLFDLVRTKNPAPRVDLGSGVLPSSLMKLDVVSI